MLVPNTPEHRETELECKMCIFDKTKLAINEAILAQALAAQADCVLVKSKAVRSGKAMAYSASIHLLP